MPRCNRHIVAHPDVEALRCNHEPLLNAREGSTQVGVETPSGNPRTPADRSRSTSDTGTLVVKLARRAKVLCAIDTRSRSNATLDRAFTIARGLGAQLLLVHVTGGTTAVRSVRRGEARARFILDSFARKLARRGQKTQVSLRAGRPHKAIADAAIEWDADLIVLGPYRERFGDSFLGTTAERIARKAERPVLVVNRQPTGIYQHVLLASDLSPMSGGIARVAKQLGLLQGARTSVVHALEHTHRAMLYLAGVREAEARKYWRTQKEIAANEVAMQFARVDPSSMEFSFFSPEAPPLPAIEQVAKLVGSELVVVGCSRFPELKRWFVGSVSNDVLRWLESDVLLVSPTAARRTRQRASATVTPRLSSRLGHPIDARGAAIEPTAIGRHH